MGCFVWGGAGVSDEIGVMMVMQVVMEEKVEAKEHIYISAQRLLPGLLACRMVCLLCGACDGIR